VRCSVDALVHRVLADHIDPVGGTWRNLARSSSWRTSGDYRRRPSACVDSKYRRSFQRTEQRTRENYGREFWFRPG
jgi:hypothetical protein